MKVLKIFGIALAIALASIVISVISIALLHGLTFLLGSKLIAYIILMVPSVLFLAWYWYDLGTRS